jgi:ADP-ribose pyrophosphatase YjhB (NUDIX family)
MDKKKKIKITAPKTRRTWKIKPYTRVHSNGKSYDRHRKKDEDQQLVDEALGETSGEKEGIQDELRFCPRCGGSLSLRRVGDRRRLVCSDCDFIFYRNPVPAVAAIIPRGAKIVMVRRAEQPRRGDWCLPAGFMELHETPQQCAVREVKEETGLNITIKKLYGVDLGRDDPRARVVLIIFLAELVSGQMQAGDDASEVGLFGPGELPDNIAFNTHRRAIARYFGEYHEQNTGA